MKRRWFVLLVLLGGGLLLLSACSPRVTSTPAPPVVPPSTQAPVQPTAPTGNPTPAQQEPPPQLADRPEMTIQGNLEGGIPFGVTADGHFFKGDPQAPLMLFEFSDYQ